MPKIKEALFERKITASKLGELVGCDRYLMSKFVNGVCLPVKKMGLQMCNVLNKEVNDLWDENELFTLPQNSLLNKRNEIERQMYYKLTARVPKGCCNLLQQDNLRKLGYLNVTDFVIQKVLGLEKEIKEFEKREKKIGGFK
jgi:transcriptional regulator with XRE-family HTH domain